MRRALPGLYAVTECKSVSAFPRRGKTKGFRMLQIKLSLLFYKFAFPSKITKKYLLENILFVFNFSRKTCGYSNLIII